MQNTNVAVNEKDSTLYDGGRTDAVLRPIVYIGFVTGSGGDAVQMMELARGVQERGHEVRIIVSDTPATRIFAQRCREMNVSVECSPLVMACQTSGTDQSLLKIIKLLRRFRHSTIHIYTGDLVLPRKAMIALRLMRLQEVFVTVQNPFDYLDPLSPRARFWAKTVQHFITRVICPSNFSYRIQRRLCVPEVKLAVIRNGVNPLQYAHGSADVVRKGALGHLPQQAQILLFTARMEIDKGPMIALAAFQRIAPDMPNIHFVFVGLGSLQDELRASVHPALKDRVHFVGFQTNIPDWLAAATIWIHASESENCSLALLEALAAGCPIVATMCPGNDEVLVPGQNALTFTPGDIDTCTNAMRRLLVDDQLRLSLTIAARETADRFSLQNMAADHITNCYR